MQYSNVFKILSMHVIRCWCEIIEHSEKREGIYRWKSESAWPCVLDVQSDSSQISKSASQFSASACRRLYESAWQSVTKILKLSVFWIHTFGFLPTQPPIHFTPKQHHKGLVYILSHRLQKSDCQKVLSMFLYLRFGKSFETPHTW